MLAFATSPTHWFILALVFLIVFGSKRLPDLARNLGKSMGALRKAKREFEEELLKAQEPEQQQPDSQNTRSAAPEVPVSSDSPKQD